MSNDDDLGGLEDLAKSADKLSFCRAIQLSSLRLAVRCLSGSRRVATRRPALDAPTSIDEPRQDDVSYTLPTRRHRLRAVEIRTEDRTVPCPA
jgi:hypothetical protein